jgi:NAD+ kinase
MEKKKFSKIALISLQTTNEVIATLTHLIEQLKKNGLKVVIEKDTAKLLIKPGLPIIAREELYKHCELLIVVGGDGSLLNAARTAAQQNLPVIGINRGKLGFLTDIYPEEIEQIHAVLNGHYQEEQRFLLQANIAEKNSNAKQELALNDVVLISSEPGRIAEFNVQIDMRPVCTYHADGLIISTPTGSTAHALSGGGPILHPNLNAIALVPMFSHNLSTRPFVIDANSQIKIVVSTNNPEPLRLACDGHSRFTITAPSEITIQKAKPVLTLLHPLNYNYFATLRAKLHWEK